MSANTVESAIVVSGKAGHPVGGVLEHFLSIQRSKLANRLVNPEHSQGRVLLDVGCGAAPFFLQPAWRLCWRFSSIWSPRDWSRSSVKSGGFRCRAADIS